MEPVRRPGTLPFAAFREGGVARHDVRLRDEILSSRCLKAGSASPFVAESMIDA